MHELKISLITFAYIFLSPHYFSKPEANDYRRFSTTPSNKCLPFLIVYLIRRISASGWCCIEKWTHQPSAHYAHFISHVSLCGWTAKWIMWTTANGGGHLMASNCGRSLIKMHNVVVCELSVYLSVYCVVDFFV